MTIGFKSGETGLTIHLNREPFAVAMRKLNLYCVRRKYKQRAARWFGLCLLPTDCSIQFGVSLTSPWAHDELLEQSTKDMREAQPINGTLSDMVAGQAKAKKVGRNDACPCGSGLKFKKCHLS